MKFSGGTIEGQAWQTKTVSAYRSKKAPVPLIAPTYSFTGRDWWTPLQVAWDKMKTLPHFQEADYLIPTISKDYTGLIARPCTADRALRWLKAALHRHGGLPTAAIGSLTWHSFRVFIPDCAYQLGFPRDQRQYLGNWTTESTADIYTREKRNVVERVWKSVADRTGYLRMDDPTRQVRVDLNHEDWQDDSAMKILEDMPSEGPTPRRLFNVAYRDDDEEDASDRGRAAMRLMAAHSGASNSSGFSLVQDPPKEELRVVAATRKSRCSGTFTVHLLGVDGKAVGCGWEPPTTKALDLTAMHYIAEFDSYAKCARCFKNHTFPPGWDSDGAEPEAVADEASSLSSGSDTDDSVDTASDKDKVVGKTLWDGALPIEATAATPTS